MLASRYVASDSTTSAPGVERAHRPVGPGVGGVDQAPPVVGGLDRVGGRRVVGARELRSMSPTAAVSPSPTTHQSKVLPQSDTSDSRNFSRPSGAYTGTCSAAEAVAQHHVQAVDVDAVVGVAVGEHHRRQVLDRRRAPAGARSVPLPQSTQIDVSPPRSRYPLHASPPAPPYDPEHPNTVSSTSAPMPGLDGSDLGTEEPHAERPESIDGSRGEENVPRVTSAGSVRQHVLRWSGGRGPRTRSRPRSRPARRPSPSRRRWYGRAAGSAYIRARACRPSASRTGASRRSASTCTWSESTSPASTNSTNPGQAAHVSSMAVASSSATPLVRARRDGADGADHPDAAAAGDARRRPQAGLDDADHRDVELLAQRVERGGGRAVARDDQRFTSWSSSTSVISSAWASTSSRGFGPYGNRPVSPK